MIDYPSITKEDIDSNVNTVTEKIMSIFRNPVIFDDKKFSDVIGISTAMAGQTMHAKYLDMLLEISNASLSFSLPNHCEEVDVKGVIKRDDQVNDSDKVSYTIHLPSELESQDYTVDALIQLGNLFTNMGLFDNHSVPLYIDSRYCQDDYQKKIFYARFFALHIKSLHSGVNI